MENKEKILEVKDLRVSFNTYAGEVRAVRGVDFDLHQGETLCFVGESGCGKTVTSKAILRLLQPPFATIKEGSQILFRGEDVLQMDKKRLRNYRGNDVSMIFQDPMTSLNPTMTCGKQIMESLLLHKNMTKAQAREEAIHTLELVKIPDAAKRMDDYPHQMSGGMRQRVMIAIALSCSPHILIADEPTTALDVTIQAQIIDLLRELRDQLNTAIILVTHDLGVVANFADRIQVMYAGQVIERGSVREIFYEAKHPYTWALLSSVPTLDKSNKQELYTLKGTPPDLILPLEHCPFAARCEYCMPICKETMPPETVLSDTHKVSCWLQHPNAPKVQSYYDRKAAE
ncbi:MAG TPA: ABC transporter ATP-binding protein [Firmicutes bacterium]|nr:ABC transporter ATP-binding protein [Bacillota bacterium]